MYTPKKCRSHNNFKEVKVMTTKDIYERLGERVPQQKARGGIFFGSVSKVDALAAGQNLADNAVEAAEMAVTQPKATETKVESNEPTKEPEQA